MFSISGLKWVLEEQTLRDLLVQTVGGVAGGLVGGMLALRATKITLNESTKNIREEARLERNHERSSRLLALATEVNENIFFLESTMPKPTQYFKLSTSSWDAGRSAVFTLPADVQKSLFVAYSDINILNSTMHWRINSEGHALATFASITTSLMERSLRSLKSTRDLLQPLIKE